MLLELRPSDFRLSDFRLSDSDRRTLDSDASDDRILDYQTVNFYEMREKLRL